MRAIALAAATALTGALFVLTPAHADTVWDFTSGGANVDLGTSHDFAGSGPPFAGVIITATAFGPNQKTRAPARLASASRTIPVYRMRLQMIALSSWISGTCRLSLSA
jgi:hypothetical protein